MIWYNPLTWLKAGDKAADAAVGIIDGVKSGLDMLVLTDEEKLQYKQKGMQLYLDHQKLNMEQNSERSKARREIAKAIVYFTLALIIVIGSLWKIDPGWASFIQKLMVDMMGSSSFVAIIVFYFGYYGATKIAEKVKGK